MSRNDVGFTGGEPGEEGLTGALPPVDTKYLSRLFGYRGDLPAAVAQVLVRRLLPVVVAESPSGPLYRLPARGRIQINTGTSGGRSAITGVICRSGRIRPLWVKVVNDPIGGEVATAVDWGSVCVGISSTRVAVADPGINTISYLRMYNIQRQVNDPQAGGSSLWRQDYLNADAFSGFANAVIPFTPDFYFDQAPVAIGGQWLFDLSGIVLYPGNLIYCANRTTGQPIKCSWHVEENEGIE